MSDRDALVQRIKAFVNDAADAAWVGDRPLPSIERDLMPTIDAYAEQVRAAERERIAQAIEADRVTVTGWPGSDGRAWQLGHNKGLADAARIARAGGDPS